MTDYRTFFSQNNTDFNSVVNGRSGSVGGAGAQGFTVEGCRGSRLFHNQTTGHSVLDMSLGLNSDHLKMNGFLCSMPNHLWFDSYVEVDAS